MLIRHDKFMMRHGWMIVLGLLASGSADAGETVSVTRQDCSRLIQHVPDSGVAYQPGVDVNGQPVTPADLEGSGNNIKLLPEVLQFNININPVDYQARNSLAAQKAAAQKAIVANQQAKTTAETQVTTLTAQQATLAADAATLAADLVDLQATLAPLQNQVDLRTLHKTNPTYADALAAVSTKQAEIDANTAAQATVASNIASQQAIVDAAPTTEASLNQTVTSVEAQQSALSAKGLDGTSLSVAQIHYDIGKNQFFINGQPLSSPEMQALAAACAKAGVK